MFRSQYGLFFNKIIRKESIGRARDCFIAVDLDHHEPRRIPVAMTKEKTLGVNAFTGSRKSSGAEASEGEVGHGG